MIRCDYTDQQLLACVIHSFQAMACMWAGMCNSLISGNDMSVQTLMPMAHSTHTMAAGMRKSTSVHNIGITSHVRRLRVRVCCVRTSWHWRRWHHTTLTAVMRNITRIYNIGITTNVRRLRVCVCAYTGIDGTHTTTTGMRNICTETPQPAF